MFLKQLSILIMVLVVLAGFTACETEMNSVEGETNLNGRNSIIQYAVNPYECFGIEHNEMLDLVMENVDMPTDSITWPDQNLIDTISRCVYDNYKSIYNKSDDTCSYSYYQSITAPWINNLDDMDILYNQVDSLIINSTYSLEDKQYAFSILDLAEKLRDDLDFDAAQYSIDSIQTVMLNEIWDDSDCIAFITLAVFKHSFMYHTDWEYPILSMVRTGSKIARDKVSMSTTGKAVCISVDTVSGLGVFLAATAGTAGVGGAAGAWLGVKAASSASGAAALAGAYFGWW